MPRRAGPALFAQNRFAEEPPRSPFVTNLAVDGPSRPGVPSAAMPSVARYGDAAGGTIFVHHPRSLAMPTSSPGRFGPMLFRFDRGSFRGSTSPCPCGSARLSARPQDFHDLASEAGSRLFRFSCLPVQGFGNGTLRWSSLGERADLKARLQTKKRFPLGGPSVFWFDRIEDQA